MFAVDLVELAACGKAGQLLEQEAALAPAAQAEFADQLLVSSLLAGGGSDARHQFPIRHTPRLRQMPDRLAGVSMKIGRGLRRIPSDAVE